MFMNSKLGGKAGREGEWQGMTYLTGIYRAGKEWEDEEMTVQQLSGGCF